jgi:transposase-like protein
MKHDTAKHTIHVIGPDGSVLTPANLPAANTQRWSARRKAEVIAAVHGGLLTMPQACHRYGVSHDEFMEWERHYEAKGLEGLRASARPIHPGHPIH